MSAAHHIDFAAAIRETAKAMDRMPSAERVAQLNAVAQSSGRIDPERNTVLFDNEDGSSVTVSEFLAREIGLFPKVVREVSPPTQTVDSKYTGLTAAAIGVVQRIRAQDEADALAHANAVAAGPNPFDKATWNLTKQAIIRNKLPQVAAQLRARAK